ASFCYVTRSWQQIETKMAKPAHTLALFTDEEIESQVEEQRREVNYDTSEFTAEIIAKKLTDNEIYIPEYQRPHVWSPQVRSNFIESLILGIPIPYVFCCDQRDGRLEVVD